MGELVRRCWIGLPMLERFQVVIDAGVRVATVLIEKDSRQTVAKFEHKLSIRHLAIYRDPDGNFASTDAASKAPLPCTEFRQRVSSRCLGVSQAP